jgi:hypothetical protein
VPRYVHDVTIDYGFGGLAHAQKRAIIPHVEIEHEDHTLETLAESMERASAAASGARIEAAARDEEDGSVLVVVENGKRTVHAFDEGAAVSARIEALLETPTDVLLGDSFPIGGMVPLGFPSPAGERVDAWRANGGSPSLLVEELWRRAYPSIQRLAADDIQPLLSWFNGAKRTKIIASVDAYEDLPARGLGLREPRRRGSDALGSYLPKMSKCTDAPSVMTAYIRPLPMDSPFLKSGSLRPSP